MERTLILVKPDGVKRQLIGRILSRFEDAGMKIVAMKLRQVTAAHALQHYTEDLARRRGEHIRTRMVDFLQTGPVLALVVEGVNAIENIRKMVGATEPKASLPGTIRGDFAHVSFAHADAEGKVIENLLHASADAADAEREVRLWFNADEIVQYRTVHEAHTL